MLAEILLLFIAGLFGGALNSIAGGGSFITFPALLLAGVPAINANATNTFASLPGYMAGAFVMRKDISKVRHQLPRLLLVSFIGGSLGAFLLLQTPEAGFVGIVPWLLLFATLLFIFGDRINQFIRLHTAHHRHAPVAGLIALTVLLLMICIYGGFFNAGLGIISLSWLTLAGMNDIRVMNGLKLLISSCVSLIAVAQFIAVGSIAWQQGLSVLVGTVAGGAIAAHILRYLPRDSVRHFIIITSVCITAWFFYDTWFRTL